MPLDLELNLGADYIDGIGNRRITIEHGDFQIRKGKFKIIPTDDTGRQVGQRLHVRLLLRKGEVFFDTAAGFPYLQLSKFKEGTPIFDSFMQRYISDTTGVDRITSYHTEMSVGRRRINTDFSVVTASGDALQTVKEIEI